MESGRGGDVQSCGFGQANQHPGVSSATTRLTIHYGAATGRAELFEFRFYGRIIIQFQTRVRGNTFRWFDPSVPVAVGEPDLFYRDQSDDRLEPHDASPIMS